MFVQSDSPSEQELSDLKQIKIKRVGLMLVMF